jgi:hypothetical protein
METAYWPNPRRQEFSDKLPTVEFTLEVGTSYIVNTAATIEQKDWIFGCPVLLKMQAGSANSALLDTRSSR